MIIAPRMTPSVLLYLRALVFCTGVLTTLCVFAPLSLIIRPLPYRTRYRLIPVVPVAHNAGLYRPRQSLIKYPGTIDVVIGPVIDPAGRSATEITAIAEDWIEATCERLATSPARA